MVQVKVDSEKSTHPDKRDPPRKLFLPQAQTYLGPA
jgi:hypothetical protein